MNGVAIDFYAEGRFAAQLGVNMGTGGFASNGRKLVFGTMSGSR